MSSWAQLAGSGPTPEQRLEALAGAYKKYSRLSVLREALGYYNDIHPEVPEIARPLVEHIIVICVDTESHTLNTDQMTELGLVHISRKTARGVTRPGPHGWRLQEAQQFLHFRIAEHAHLRSNREDSRGPLGNRFGSTRFTTFQELRAILQHLFNQEIKTEDPELKGCKCPIVLVGHALKHDVENTTKPGLDYDIISNITVVAKVDTQSLARETKVWIPPPGMSTNEIGLRVLIEKVGFQHLDDHTACNDAARTLMCAIHMILPDRLRKSDNPSMQAVADRVEQLSEQTSPAPYGTALVCTRCGWRNHSAENCTVIVTCAACARFDVGPDREGNIRSHIETYCPHVARFKAWARRFRDATKKHGSNLRAFPDAVRSGPGADAHPWSTWPQDVGWPLTELSRVLIGMKLANHNPQFREPPAFACNMRAALGGLQVPSTGNWVTVPAQGPMSPASSPAHSVVSSTLSSTAYPPLPSASGGVAPAATSPSRPPAATRDTAPAPAVAREVRMSDQRGRARGGSSRGGLHRGGNSARRGGGGGGGAAAGASPAAGAWNW